MASESEISPGDAAPKDIGKVIVPPDVSKQDLKKLNKMAVLVTSTSPLFGQVANDLLAVKLRDKGFEVVDQTKVSEATMKALTRLEKQQVKAEGKQQEGKEEAKPQEEILNVMKIGKELGLDAVVVGTLFEGRRQLNFSDDKPQRFTDKVVVATFYVQVIDVRTEKVVLAAILDYDKGRNIADATDALAKALSDHMKR